MKYAFPSDDVKCKPMVRQITSKGEPAFMRRQENVLTKQMRKVRLHDNTFREVREAIDASDFTVSFETIKAKTFNHSNRLICQDYVLAMNPKKKRNKRWQAVCLKEYLESLEMFNMCRNCQRAIKSRKITIKSVEMTVALIPSHYRVVWDEEKQGYKYVFVEKREVFNSQCECIGIDIRKAEREKARAMNPYSPMM